MEAVRKNTGGCSHQWSAPKMDAKKKKEKQAALHQLPSVTTSHQLLQLLNCARLSLCSVSSQEQLASWKVQNTAFAVQNELRAWCLSSLQTATLWHLTSQAGSSSSADSRNVDSKGKDLTVPTAIHVLRRFQRAFLLYFKSWLHFCLSECICRLHSWVFICKSAYSSFQ